MILVLIAKQIPLSYFDSILYLYKYICHIIIPSNEQTFPLKGSQATNIDQFYNIQICNIGGYLQY